MFLKINCYLLTLLFIVPYCYTRIHTFETQNDTRRYIPLSTFGFYKGGIMEVRLDNFTIAPETKLEFLGFSIVRALNGDMRPYLDTHTSTCLLQGTLHTDYFTAAIYFVIDLNALLLRAYCGDEWKQPGHIYRNSQQIPDDKGREKIFSENVHGKDSLLYLRDVCIKLRIPISEEIRDGVRYYSTRFALSILSEVEEGLYNLYFHSCPTFNGVKTYGFTISMSEKNSVGYLSAGDMPLPTLYCVTGVVFFLSGCFWVFLLHRTKHLVSKVHCVMAILVFLRSLSLCLNGINYYYIITLGVNLSFWAVSFYISHLIERVLLFITLILIGSGWTFIKKNLTPRERCLLVVIVPLQAVATVSAIFFNESEEGSRDIGTWRSLYILADFICCVGVMFPVFWSIRRIKMESTKLAAVAKLKLYRQLFVIIFSYTYLTRILTYIISVSVPYQYSWLEEMFSVVATYFFFILTGYKFRPQENLVISDTLYKENLSRVNLGRTPMQQSKTTLMEVTEESDKMLFSTVGNEYK